MRDFTPAFCDDCEVALSVMVDQNGDAALVCACPPTEGRYDLDDDAQEWVDDRAHRMEP